MKMKHFSGALQEEISSVNPCRQHGCRLQPLSPNAVSGIRLLSANLAPRSHCEVTTACLFRARARRSALIASCAESNAQLTAFPPGSVALVGAGPGAGDLLTLRAAQLLGAAEVVLYDRLGCSAALSHVRSSATLISVAKGRGVGTGSQGWICEELARHAAAGKRVVRLKGGDPFTFGRGGEEAAHLRALNVQVLVCPGVTAAAGAAAALQIPLTHFGVSAAIRLCTAHDVRDGFALHNGGRDTIVVYMGLREVAAAAAALLKDGMPGRTPAAAVQDATMGTQKVVWSCVARLAKDVEKAALVSPTLIIIGDVVGEAPGWVAWAGDLVSSDAA